MAYVNRTYYNNVLNQANQSDKRIQEANEKILREKQKLAELTKKTQGLSVSDLEMIQNKFDESNSTIQEEILKLREELGVQLGKQAIDNRRIIEDVRKLAEANKKNLDNLNSDISKLDQKLNEYISATVSSINEDRKQALLYYDQFFAIISSISNLYPEKYEVFFPDQLTPGISALRSVGEYALEDITEKRYEAAISVIQSHLQEALNVLAALEILHNEYLATRQDVEQLLNDVLKQIDECHESKKKILSVNSTDYTDDHSVSYWAKEVFAEIDDIAQRIREQFDLCADAHDTNGLNLVKEDIHRLNTLLQTGTAISSNECHLHYECCEMAVQIYEKLLRNDNNRWILDDQIVNEEDLRDPVIMTISNPEGYKLLITCAPERSSELNGAGTVRTDIEVFDMGEFMDDVSECRVVYKNATTVLAGIKLQSSLDDDSSQSGIEKNTVLKNTISQEIKLRNTWIEKTKEFLNI